MKYKVWHIERKEWIHDTWSIFIDPDGDIWEIEERGSYDRYMSKTWINERVKVVYATGLQDKNGTPIYEGDILRIAEWKMNGEVNFASGMFKVRDRRRENFNPSLASFMVEIRCEVIGNIWENADLLRDSAIESTELPKP